jgi:hypothetical protein
MDWQILTYASLALFVFAVLLDWFVTRRKHNESMKKLRDITESGFDEAHSYAEQENVLASPIESPKANATRMRTNVTTTDHVAHVSGAGASGSFDAPDTTSSDED